jgi:hypothetical protein
MNRCLEELGAVVRCLDPILENNKSDVEYFKNGNETNKYAQLLTHPNNTKWSQYQTQSEYMHIVPPTLNSRRISLERTMSPQSFLFWLFGVSPTCTITRRRKTEETMAVVVVVVMVVLLLVVDKSLEDL